GGGRARRPHRWMFPEQDPDRMGSPAVARGGVSPLLAPADTTQRRRHCPGPGGYGWAPGPARGPTGFRAGAQTPPVGERAFALGSGSTALFFVKVFPHSAPELPSLHRGEPSARSRPVVRSGARRLAGHGICFRQSAEARELKAGTREHRPFLTRTLR